MMDSLCLLCLFIIPHALLGQQFFEDLSGNSSQVIPVTQATQRRREWGPWTEWTECGQTCGYGTQYRIRRCHRSNSKDECLGPDKQLKICNVRECPAWHQDYRSKECKKHDHIQYGSRRYRWVPYINEKAPCQLSCKSVGYGYYAKFKQSVADEVTCNEEGTGVCMNGQCVLSGCDGILGSGTKPDRCGVCDGDGDTCEMYSGIFTRTHLRRRAYNLVTTIPVGARSINISELSRSRNYLALSTADGYFLNGNLRLQREGSLEGAGTTFTYGKSREAGCKGECLTSAGPTNTSLRVELLFFGRNPGVLYSYTVPSSQRKYQSGDDGVQQFKVRVRNSPEHVTARPYTRRNQQLNRRTDAKDSNSKATRQTLSNDAAVPSGRRVDHDDRTLNPRRRLSPLASKLRGSDGSGSGSGQGHHRDYRTSNRSNYRGSSKNDYRVSNGNDYQKSDGSGYRQPKSSRNLTGNVPYRHYYHTNALDDIGDLPVKGQIPRDGSSRSRINSIQGDRSAVFGDTTQRNVRPNYVSSQSSLDNTIPLPPPQGRRRNPVSRNSISSDNKIYSWRISGFTKCTEPCGGGLQDTRVVCVKSDSQVEVMDEDCDVRLKPDTTTVVCNNQPCKARWVVEDWSPCSVTCARGLQTRDVACQQRISPTLNIPVPASTCPTPRPSSRQYCQLDPCFVWKPSNWTKCSAVCGLGQRSRSLMCVDRLDNKVREDKCVHARPKEEEICDMGSCAHGWFHSKWTKECSSECGRGLYERRVYCSAPDGSALDNSKCGGESKKPREKKSCKADKPCGGQWFTGGWSKCNSTCGTDSYRTRDVLCIKRHGKRVRGITKNHNCDESLRPASHDQCTSLPACTPQWFMMTWSECSKSCDTGVRTREIKCIDENLEPSSDCDRKRKPAKRQSCNTHPCHAKYAEFVHSSGSKTQILQQDGTIIDVPSCEDKKGARFCRVASQARMCVYAFYKELCCDTCRKAAA